MSAGPWLGALLDGLGFLTREGFELADCSEAIRPAGDRICHVQYASVVARRVFSVTCLPERGHVRTSIASMDERFSFGDAGAACIREPRYDDMPGEGVAKLQRYLQALQAELLTKHRGLLHGAPIVNDAFDWSPYK